MDSSALAAVGYDAATGTLLVRFRSGEAYAYLDVPPEAHAALMTAPSKGRFFQAEIDPAYRYVRLGT